MLLWFRRASNWGVLVITLCLLATKTLSAQDGTYAIGTSINLVTGGTNKLSNNRLIPNTQTQPFTFFYGGYPTIDLKSIRARSEFEASYGFGINRTESGSKLHSNSHSTSMNFSNTLSPKWKIDLSEAFQMTDDSATLNAFRGFVPPQDFDLVFEPTALNISNRTNTAGGTADYSFSDRSTLSFSGTHHVRDYEGEGANRSLSDQQGANLGLTYRRRTGQRETWSTGYKSSYFDFRDFDNHWKHNGYVEYSIEFAGQLQFALTVGFSRAQNRRSREAYLGYETSANLQKTSQNQSFSLSYTQRTGVSSGLGSVSDLRRAAFSLRREWGDTNVSMNVSAFDSRPRLDNIFGTRGIQGEATFGYSLTDTLSIEAGALYNKQDKRSLYALEQKRVFVSLRYSNPALFRFSK